MSNLIKYQIRLSKYWESVYFVKFAEKCLYTDSNQYKKIKSILFLKGYPEITKQYTEIDEYTFNMIKQYEGLKTIDEHKRMLHWKKSTF